MCGTSTGNNGATTAGNGRPNAAINTFELQEDLKSRTVRMYLTDDAVSHVGEALTAVFADRITARPRGVQRIVSPIDTTGKLLSPALAPQDQGEPPSSAVGDAPTGGDQERLRKIFEYEGEELRLEDGRLKADSGQDYVRRLTFLFLYAHELEGRKPIPYATLRRIIEAAKLWDSNTRHALAHKLPIEIADDNVRLKAQGRELAIATLNEILEPNHPDPGWTPETKMRTARQVADPRDAKSSKASGKRGRKRSNQAEEWAEKWEKHTDHINGHFALKGKPVKDKVILALWAIHKVAGKVATALLVQRFIKAAFAYDENERNVANALVRKQGDNQVIKAEGGYKLTPTGSKHADTLSKKS